MADGRKKSEDALRKAISDLETLTGRKTFVLVRPFDHLLPEEVLAETKRVLGETSEHDVDVVLESDGGIADAAYKAALVLRTRGCKSVRVLVPSWAKSAATLFALCGDVITMPSGIAELGPLDAQVTDPRNPALLMSALDGYQSVEYIRDYALQTQHLAVMQMLDRTKARVPLGEILDHASSFADDVVSPIMSQVRPLDFGGWGRTLDIGKVYAGRLLNRFNMRRSSGDPEEAADRLVYGYPHHGFVIDLEEAQSLGFTTEEMASDLYDASIGVVDAAYACRQLVCEDGEHVLQPGYTGFSPAKAATNRKPKEEVKNGAGDAHDVESLPDARDLRRHPDREGQTSGSDGG